MLWPWSGFSKRQRVAKARSDAIDRQIMEDGKRYKQECKILLLGSHESGKTIILNQMKIIHQDGFSRDELIEYRPRIFKNVLDSAGTLARVVRRVGVGALAEGERPHAALLLAAFPAAGAADKNGDDEVVEDGLDPVMFTHTAERGLEREENMGIEPGRLRARPGTAEVEASAPAVDVRAQMNVMLSPGLADAIWHVARTPAVGRLLHEHPAEFYSMESTL
jgi:hypothetical protein